MKKHAISLAISTVMCVGLLLTAGCNKEITKKDIWKNPTPNMEGLGHTEDQLQNARVRVTDTNLRQISRDWDVLWLNNRPSYMTDYPVH